MENRLDKRWGKNIATFGRNSPKHFRKRNKAKEQKLEESQSQFYTTSLSETQELQQESKKQTDKNMENLLENEVSKALQRWGKNIVSFVRKLLNLRKRFKANQQKLEPQPADATPSEINKQELQESREPNSEVGSKVERIFFVINILAELLSVGFDHLSSVNMHRYALIAMIMSHAAADLCIIELAYKAGKERVVWRWESMLPWFYHSSSPNYRPFSTVPEMAGLVFAILQTISSTVAYVLYLQHVKYSFNVSLLPLVLALAIFYSRFMKKPNPEVPSEKSDNFEQWRNQDFQRGGRN